MKVFSPEIVKYAYFTYFMLELREKKLEDQEDKLLDAMDELWFKSSGFMVGL